MTRVPDGLRVWLAAWHPDPADREWAQWRGLLSTAERQRCSSIGTHAGRLRFAASHAAAHVLVPEPSAWREGRASLSHTRTLAAIATAPRPLGIDVEADLPRTRWVAADRQRWPDSPASGWREFVTRWVMTEARYKAHGGDAATRLAVEVGRVVGLGLAPDHVMAIAWRVTGSALRGRR